MRPPDQSAVPGAREPFFPDLLQGEFRSAELFFATAVALARNQSQRRYCPWRIHQWAALIKEMRYRLRRATWVRDLRARYRQDPAPHLETRLLISFWARVWDISVQELCRWLAEEEDGTLRRAFGLPQGRPCHPQRISELHRLLGGTAGKEQAHQRLRDLVGQLLDLDQVTAAEVEGVAAQRAACGAPIWEDWGRAYGFDYFLGFVFWHGVLAQLERALGAPLKANGFSLRDLFTAYLERLDERVKTQDDLAAQLRNRLWGESERPVVAPVSQTLTNFLTKLDLDQLILLYQGEARRAHRGKKRFVVAVDAVLLELFGRYEGADWHWDAQEQQAIFGYKLHVIFSVTTGEPIGFYLHQAGDKDADVLDRLVAQARTALGVRELGIILFDKGYWRVAEFKALVSTQRESLITPAKRYQSVQQALTTIPRRHWQRVGPNLRCAETTVYFGEQEAQFRLVAWKKLGRRVVKDEEGQRVKDAQGQVVTEPVVIIHSYLTNMSEVELEADQVLGMYSQRWGVEDFFEEIQNQYYLAKFPGTALVVVKRHIILTFYLYILVHRFQQQAAEWLERTQYATMELRRFGKEFLQTPVAYLRWLQAGKPRDQARRSDRRSSAFLRRFFPLGASP